MLFHLLSVWGFCLVPISILVTAKTSSGKVLTESFVVRLKEIVQLVQDQKKTIEDQKKVITNYGMQIKTETSFTEIRTFLLFFFISAIFILKSRNSSHQ